MSGLHEPIALCEGRVGLADEAIVCPRRDNCARYKALVAMDGPDLARHQVYTLMCRDGRDAIIPIEVQP